MKFNFFILFIVSINIVACTKSSTGRNQITLFSNSELDKMGITSFDQMKEKEKVELDKDINDYVQCVALAITKNVPSSTHKGNWEVVVFDSAQINAFALPGGKIGVYKGILSVAETQNQLAAIIGHEVAHVIEHHSNERMSSSQLAQAGMTAVDAAMSVSEVQNRNLWMAGLGLGVQYGILMPYGRTHESEADIVGQNLMAISGFNPKASITLWQNMAKQSKSAPPEFMSTHPSNETRIKQLTQNLKKSTPLFSNSKTSVECHKPNIL